MISLELLENNAEFQIKGLSFNDVDDILTSLHCCIGLFENVETDSYYINQEKLEIKKRLEKLYEKLKEEIHNKTSSTADSIAVTVSDKFIDYVTTTCK